MSVIKDVCMYVCIKDICIYSVCSVLDPVNRVTCFYVYIADENTRHGEETDFPQGRVAREGRGWMCIQGSHCTRPGLWPVECVSGIL